MPRLLYLNNRYRTYERRKYELLGSSFELTVLWINRAPAGETPPAELLSRFRHTVLDPERPDVLRPRHPLRSLRLVYRIWRLARDSDLVLSSTSDSWKSKMAFLGARAAGRPIAFRKETWRRDAGRARGIRSLNARLQARLTDAIERRAVAMLPTGSKAREHLLSKGIPSERILPFHYLHPDLGRLPLDAARSAELESRKRGALTFLYLGRIIPRKGLEVLIRAFRRLRDEARADVRLWIAGEALAADTGRGGVSTAYLERCRLAAEGEPRIEALGAVPPTEVHHVYAAADVFVHPHLHEVDGRPTHEGWGNVVTEAASMGKPIITTDRVASAFDVVRSGENGFLVSAENLEEELIEAMRFFVRRPDAIPGFGRAARAAFEKAVDPQLTLRSIRRVFELAGIQT